MSCAESERHHITPRVGLFPILASSSWHTGAPKCAGVLQFSLTRNKLGQLARDPETIVWSDPCHVMGVSLQSRSPCHTVCWSASQVRIYFAYIRLYMAWYLSTDVLMQGENKIVSRSAENKVSWVWEWNKGNPPSDCQGNFQHCSCSFYSTACFMLRHAWADNQLIFHNFVRLVATIHSICNEMSADHERSVIQICSYTALP